MFDLIKDSRLFIENKYFSRYLRLVEQRFNEPYTGEFPEGHHVLPKCYGIKSPVIIVSIREHFVLHRLLCKCIVEDKRFKAQYALWAFAKLNKHRRSFKLTSHQVEIARKMMKQGHKEYMRRVKDTPEFKASRRQNALGRNPEEAKRKKSESAKKRIWSPEVKKKMSESRKMIYQDPIKREEVLSKYRASRFGISTVRAS